MTEESLIRLIKFKFQKYFLSKYCLKEYRQLGSI